MDPSPIARRILLVDVASPTRLLMCHVLRNLGYHVDETSDPAGRAARDAACALVVLGARSIDDEVMRTLEAARAQEHAPALVLVGDPQDLPASLVERLDPQACLPEPLEFGQFLATVRSLIDDRDRHVRAAARTPACPDPVDLERLVSFADGDPDLVEELTALYFMTARTYLADAEVALRTDADATRTLHSLKGASANYGAVDVAELARTAEQDGLTPARIDALKAALAHAEQFMTTVRPAGNPSA